MRVTRWWQLRALRRSPLSRFVDRVEAVAAIAALAILIFVGLQCAHFSQSLYRDRAQTFAAEAATRHPAEATALSSTKPTTPGPAPGYAVQIQWFAQNATHDGTLRLNHEVKTGDHVRIWLNQRGELTQAPRTDVDARTDAIGSAALLWLVAVSIAIGLLTVLRRVMDRIRYRAWDRSWRLMVDNGGGWATKNT
jgi:hypothetical protein